MFRRDFLGTGIVPLLPWAANRQPHTDLIYCKAGETDGWEHVKAYVDGKVIDQAIVADVKGGYVLHIIKGTDQPLPVDWYRRIEGRVQILFIDDQHRMAYQCGHNVINGHTPEEQRRVTSHVEYRLTSNDNR